MGSLAAPHSHPKPSPARRLFTAAVLLFVVLAVAAIKLLPLGSLEQPLDVQHLLQVAGCRNASLDGGAPDIHTADDGMRTTERRLRILMLSHDLTLTGAPQVLYEVAAYLHTRGHNIRRVTQLRHCALLANGRPRFVAQVPSGPCFLLPPPAAFFLCAVGS